MLPALLLVRHAPAAPTAPGGDAERPLTPRGILTAAALARGLARLLPDQSRLLTSPARRCRQTAEAVAAALADRPGGSPPLDVRPELAVDASASALRDLARAAGSGTVLVGHLPELTGLATALLAPASLPFGLPPGSVLGLSPGEAGPDGPWRLDLAATAEDLEALTAGT